MRWSSPGSAIVSVIHWATFSQTPDGAGQITFAHGASFTPSFVSVTVSTPFATTPCYGLFISADATNAHMQMVGTNGSIVGVPLTGHFVAYL
jgi:hypothetical protein